MQSYPMRLRVATLPVTLLNSHYADSTDMGAAGEAAPLVVHIIYRLDYGDLENGLVNLLNRMPADRFRHVIVCLAGVSDFRQHLQRKEVAIHDLRKHPGNDPRVYLRLWLLLRKLSPAIVHTRNFGSVDLQWIALAARPVITAYVGGNGELVRSGVTAVLYDPGNQETLTGALVRYCEQPQLRAAHGAAGRQRVVEEFSLDAMVGRYVDFYQQLIAH